MRQLQQNDLVVYRQPLLLQQPQNNYNYSSFSQANSLENEFLKYQLNECQRELSKYKQRDQQLLCQPQNNQYILQNPAINKVWHYLFSYQQQLAFNQLNVQMKNYQLQQQQQEPQQQLICYQNPIQHFQQNAQQNYIAINTQQQNACEQQAYFQNNYIQINNQQCSVLQNNIPFPSNPQNLNIINQPALTQNFSNYECQSSNKPTAPVEDNSQQITLNQISLTNETILSPKTNSPGERQNLKIKIPASFSGANEEERKEIRQKPSKEISSLQNSNSFSLSDEEDIEAGNELKRNSSPNSASSLNKRTRCLYEPLFRIISPVLPEKKSYKKNIIKYLISYQQGKEQPNEKTGKFTAYLEQSNSKMLAKYITELLQSCKMAQNKKDDKFAHEYIADRIYKCFQRKQSKIKVQSNIQ
ncbi:hypothetical protein ABPG72_012270 [Tetrahymena utriculariae]